MASSLAKICVHDGLGAFRAVALNGDGHACRLFEQRWGGFGEAIRFGQSAAGRLRTFAESQGGAFIELETGEEVFLSLRTREGLTEGQAVSVRCVAGYRSEKLARVKRLEMREDKSFDAFTAWVNSLPSGAQMPQFTDSDAVDFAFEEALAQTLSLSGGGQVYIDHTRALCAIDVDRSGHIGKGSVGARALTLNTRAVREAARQIALRDIGGTVIIDCVSPINRSAADQIKSQFQTVFAAYSGRHIRTAAPLPFGLLQAAIAWGHTPVRDLYLDAAGQPTSATRLLDWLRKIEREALASPTIFLQLNLSAATYQAYLSVKAICDSMVQTRLSGRVVITNEQTRPEGISRR